MNFDPSDFMTKLEQAREAPAKVDFARQAGELLAAAQANCPVDTGELVASGRVDMGPNGPEVVFDAPHAAAVHERLDLVHQSGHAKFLERAILDNREKFFEESQDALNEELSK